jgi:hypothetical protein
MKTTNPFHDDAEHMAREFKRLAAEREATLWTEEDPLDPADESDGE